MGFFSSLFGGKNRGPFEPTSDLMSEDQFWNIIKNSYNRSKGITEHQIQLLGKILHRMSPQDIIKFENRFSQLRGKANDWKLWGAAFIINGGCSDDAFLDFRGWLIAQGKELYYQAIADPDSLAGLNKEKLNVEWEGFSYVASEVFEEITQENIPSTFEEDHETTGAQWKEEGDDLKNLLPKLWTKYSQTSSASPDDDPTWSRKDPPAGL